MPYVKLTNPQALFIHVPKTAGKSVIHLWMGGPGREPYENVKGRFPSDRWDDYKFGFVRDPIERFLSAYHMFISGRKDEDGTERVPILPDYTIDHFIDRALSSIDDFYEQWSVTRHTLPMSNELIGLQFADYIGRYERFEKDMEYILETLKANKGPIPRFNVSNKEPVVLTEENYDRLCEYYREDFKLFNYRMFSYGTGPLFDKGGYKQSES